MAAGGSAQPFDVLDLQRSGHPDFFTSLEEVEAQTPILPYTHAVRRAWEKMDLGGVLYVDRSPAAYFKEVPDITDLEVRRLQSCLWNHGITPILVLVSPREVRVYSGWSLPAGPDDRPDDADRLVRTLNCTSDVLEIRQLVRAIESGQLLNNYHKSFDRERSVDRHLLRSLAVVRDELRAEPDGLRTPAIHGLLTRLLFACYLVEREIVVGDRLSNARLAKLGPAYTVRDLLLKDVDPGEAKERLYLLFGELKSRFNGTLFDVDLSAEKQRVNDRHMGVIQDFLAGHDSGSRQLALGFWAYDFRVIPVETISAIYQDFIEAEGPSKRREAGAYYTPPHLAELVVDTALEDREEARLLDTTVLDPACGSGVFLVSVFNRMALEWHRRNPNGRNKTKARELIGLLKDRVFGADSNETACRIACFSLYLALLDQLDPRDIDALEEQGQQLPPLLLPKDETQPPGDPRPIVCGNFFDPELPLARRDFDLVIGNPPWVSRGEAKDALFLHWRSLAPEIRAPQKQMAHGFMWKAPELLKDDGTACLLLPSAVLLNQTDAFQKAWFAGTCVEKIINLSDLRHLLFVGGKHPGVIMRFARAASSSGREPITYENPKVDVTSLLGGPVHILEQDATTIRSSEVLASAEVNDAPVVWKTRFWGTPRDIRFLARLMDLPRLGKIAGQPGRHARWICGQGFQPYNPRPGSNVQNHRAVPCPWDGRQLFLDAKSRQAQLIFLETDCRPIGNQFPRIHRMRDQRIYQPPLVLVSQGGNKAAFVDFPVIFKDSFQSIKGEFKDARLLKFLAAVLSSDFAAYFLFHTAANWGTERTQVHFSELLRLPFPLPEECDNPRRAKAIIAEVAGKFDRLKKKLTSLGPLSDRAAIVAKVRRELEPLVREYYDVDRYEAMLIEDTVDVFEPSSTPASASTDVPTLRPASRPDREKYAATITGMLNTWASRAGFRVSATVNYSQWAGQAILTLSRGASARLYQETGIASDLKDAMERVAAALPKVNGGFARCRGLKVFDGDQIHILKTLTLGA